MFSPDDTIVAIATPPGRGGIGVVRISGPDAARVAAGLLDRREPLVPRHATLATAIDRRPGDAAAVDSVVATYFPGPASYTGQDVVEVSAHGSPVLLQQILGAALHAGTRLAEPGEFTLRAFLNGRLDLAQAEAVADLIDAVTPVQARLAFDQLQGTVTTAVARIDAALFDLIAHLEASLDFPDEGYRFIEPGRVMAEVAELESTMTALLDRAESARVVREGRQVAIAGPPNAGKSSIFNYLVGTERAIVTASPGTTRDLVTELVDVAGIPTTIIDTAGIRDTDDEAETQGVERARRACESADVVLVVLDRSRPLGDTDVKPVTSSDARRRVVVVNKIDLPAAWGPERLGNSVPEGPLFVSATTGEGMAGLTERLADVMGVCEGLRDQVAIANVRHIDLLVRARSAVAAAREAIEAGASEEFVLSDLQRARGSLEEITGRRAPDAVVRRIFERFCIGK